MADTGVLTLIQRFGSALNLNIRAAPVDLDYINFGEELLLEPFQPPPAPPDHTW